MVSTEGSFISVTNYTPTPLSLRHLLLNLFWHVDQTKSVEHPIDIRHTTDISQRLGSVHYLSDFTDIVICQHHGTPSKALAALSVVDPQLLGEFISPALLQLMPETHQKYLTYNEDDFKVWAMSVGPMTEHVVDFFLESGKAPEQGYKACASLTKLGERYGKERLESACARVHAYGTTPSIRNISSILKSKQDVKAKTSTAQEQSSNTARYGITRGASYFANGGEHK